MQVTLLPAVDEEDKDGLLAQAVREFSLHLSKQLTFAVEMANKYHIESEADLAEMAKTVKVFNELIAADIIAFRKEENNG